MLKTIGKTGQAEGEFNLPTELRLDGPNLMVVDAMNFRVQVFDRVRKLPVRHWKDRRQYRSHVPAKGSQLSTLKAIFTWWMPCGAWCRSSIRRASCCITSAAKGTHAGEFQLPAGLFISHDDRVYVVDSFNRRVQVFHYVGMKKPVQEAAK